MNNRFPGLLLGSGNSTGNDTQRDTMASNCDFASMSGSGGLPMTSESWMQVAARASQLATQLREMENLGVVGAATVANPIRGLPMAPTPVAGFGFMPQLSQSNDGVTNFWATSRGNGGWMPGIANSTVVPSNQHWNTQHTQQVSVCPCT
jgi:hypothetical protein